MYVIFITADNIRSEPQWLDFVREGYPYIYRACHYPAKFSYKPDARIAFETINKRKYELYQRVAEHTYTYVEVLK